MIDGLRQQADRIKGDLNTYRAIRDQINEKAANQQRLVDWLTLNINDLKVKIE